MEHFTQGLTELCKVRCLYLSKSVTFRRWLLSCLRRQSESELECVVVSLELDCSLCFMVRKLVGGGGSKLLLFSQGSLFSTRVGISKGWSSERQQHQVNATYFEKCAGYFKPPEKVFQETRPLANVTFHGFCSEIYSLEYCTSAWLELEQI